ncbi:MAG: hypothetical protein KZQ58_07060 [gamma proteobacterium symbiont of Bathyaustriella thionipta]|nr:hypothetical protein [gamma proteobacterium symbiont of Bathyaustriella thionipta]
MADCQVDLDFSETSVDHINAYFKKVTDAFSGFYSQHPQSKLDSEFLYLAYRELDPSEYDMQALIGMAFRLSSMNMIFTSDVYKHLNYIVPGDAVLSSTSSTTDFLKVGFRTSFSDYINEIYFPYFLNKISAITREQLIDESSLSSIGDYLQSSDKIGLMHNADDPILLPGEIEILREMFPGRASIYPYGGHCGNMEYRDNVDDMIHFFRQGDPLEN